MGFADDIAIVSVAKTIREIEEKTNTAIRNVSAWLDEAGLKLAAQADILSPSRVPKINSGYKSGGTKYFHAQMAITVGEQLKRKMHIYTCPLYNPLDGEETLRAELLRNPVPNWS